MRERERENRGEGGRRGRGVRWMGKREVKRRRERDGGCVER